MSAVRYWIGVLMVVTMPPSVLFWLIVHPLTPFWRRRGRPLTYTIVTAICLTAVWALYRSRDSLLMTDLGTNYLGVAFAVPLYAMAIVVGLGRRKLLTRTILVGAPQLAQTETGTLLTRGVYGRIRHPRYVEVFLGTCAFALFVNYQGVYILVPVMAVCLYVIVLLEERELRRRFGDEYDAYCRRVPRFLPRLRTP